MKVLLITGGGGTGKSTIVREMSNLGYSTFHSSAAIRSVINLEEFKENASEAPIQYDNIVEERLLQYLESRAENGEVLTVVEAVPRSLESISTVNKIAERYECHVAILHTEMDERQKRLSQRIDRKEFDKKRLDNENPNHFQQLKELLVQSLADKQIKSLSTIGTDDKKPNMIVGMLLECIGNIAEKTEITKASASALNGFHERNGYEKMMPNPQRMLERMFDEMHELYHELGDIINNKRNIESEYADILHFMFCLGEACGISQNHWIEVFKNKTRINQARLQFPDLDKHQLNGNLIDNILKEKIYEFTSKNY